MSVNIYDGTNLIPIAGKTVPMPTPDYVDVQYSSSTTYSKGMTCISGNKRYRYINSTASSGHQPPNATYWEELSVAEELKAGIDLSVFNDLSSFTAIESWNERIPNLNGGWKKIGNLVYLYVTFNEIDKTKFGSGFDYWRVTGLNINIPAPIYRVPCLISDPHDSFQSAFCDKENNYLYLALCGYPEKYDNSKADFFKTTVMGIYTTNQ